MANLIEELLICKICKNKFDLNAHRPLIIKCGHTFCKHCILSSKEEENDNLCPLDNQKNVFNIESSINNLLIEDILKKVFNLEEKSPKQIIYIKPDIKRNRSPSLKNIKNNIKDNKDNKDNKVENEERSEKKNTNTISLMNSEKIRSSTGYHKYKNSSDFRFSQKEPPHFSKVNMKKIDIEDDNIIDDMNESIETIPLNEDKSVMNISFKDEWTALLGKNIEKKISKGELEIINNNIEDTLMDKISKIDDEFITTSIANLFPSNANNINNNEKANNNNVNNNNIKENNNIKNYNINFLKNNNRYINNSNALKIATIESIKKMSKNINIDANILKYASSTYNSKNKIAVINKIERRTHNNSKNNNINNNNNIKNNDIVNNKDNNINKNNENSNNENNVENTPKKGSFNNSENSEYKNNILLQTYNKVSNQPYHKTVITNKSTQQNKRNSSKNNDSRKETEESKNNGSQGIDLENKIKNKTSDDEIKREDKIFNQIKEIPIEINKKNNYENQITNKSYAELEENKYIKISNSSVKHEKVRRKNSDIISDIKITNIQMEKSQKPKDSKISKNQREKNNLTPSKNENKKPEKTNLVIQNFDDSINNLENSIIIMKNFSKNDNILLKLKKDLITLLLESDDKKQSIKSIEENPKFKKYYNYIEKSLSNEKLKENQNLISLKLYPNNDFFIGYIDNGNNEIKNGILYYNNGDYYEGEFQNGKKEGFGIIIYKNGTRYEGIFKNNKHNGYGKLIQLDGEVFIGDWKEGKINGKGVRYHSNGDRYIGSYINNIRNGEGHYIFSNGDSYEGNWDNGKANGKGKFTFKNGNVYEGEFKDNIIFGKGKFTMNNGDVYIGVFKNGLINGKGSYKNNKGEKYNGYFFNGKKHGMGKLVDKDNNEIANGYWNMDNFVGKKNINEYM